MELLAARAGLPIRMKLRIVIAGCIAMVLLAACGAGSKGSATSATQPLSAVLEKAGPTPSASSKMVCEQEARVEIAASLGFRETRVTKPTWTDHVYSCTYVYPKGKITLSVKELVSEQTTTDYYDQLARELRRGHPLFGLGQGASVTEAGTAVVRKDYKVLLVDAQSTSAAFAPLMTRSDIAQNVMSVIMGCWTGA